MKLVIFSEAGFEYGFGHFYRMAGLCEKAITIGGKVEMHLMADDAARSNLKRDYVFFTDWLKPENYESILDKESTLVVDSYHVDIKQLEQFQKHARDMIVIDDNIRIDYHDMKILNPNYFATCLEYPKDRGNTLYIGGDYTLLRSEFDCTVDRKVSEKVSNILITMGGTDLRELTVDAIEATKTCSDNARVHVVCTKAYHNLDKIKNVLDADDTLHLNIGAKEMCTLMQKCDFAVATAGQTTNEVIKMQIPSVLIAVADNQMINTRYLSGEGVIEAIIYDGDLSEEDYKTIQGMFDVKTRRRLADKMKTLQSGRSGKDLICETAFGGFYGQ